MKDERLQVRARTAEKLAFRRAAAKAGLTLSDWLRIAGRKQAVSELGEDPEDLFPPVQEAS